MGFATSWLNEKALFPELIKDAPDCETGIIVVVPACNEPGIATLLDSLALCNQPKCKVEIIIVVNAQPASDDEAIMNNSRCLRNIERWKKENKQCFFRLFSFDMGRPPIDSWGVGLARKTGMDEALRRFNSVDKPGGVIVCLDADCTVEKNYFISIEENLLHKKERTACSIYFEHPLKGADFIEDIYKYVTLYELHLRYYIWGLKYSGFPYAFHTVGSAIAVKAFQYVKAGGMNRRQAGEDFYFVQKLVPLGGYFALNSTTVIPSPRESLRVPFGTGAAISRLMNNPGEEYLTYDTEAFMELRSLFTTAGNLFQTNNRDSVDYYRNLPEGLRSFIGEEVWLSRINEIRINTSGYGSFTKRFFGWFNMFRIVKYLNHVHTGIFRRQPVPDSAFNLLSAEGHKINSRDPFDLLVYFRSIDKRS